MDKKIPLNNNLIIDKTFAFAIEIIGYCEYLQNDRKFIIANQLLKSGTSIGANSREAQNAESQLDFIHKFKIAAKEADETEYWLLLCNAVYKDHQTTALLIEIKIIQKIITKIIASSKNKLANRLIN